MELKDMARGVPDEIWTVFEPILPPVIWCGNGRPPKGNRECFHALLYVLVSGIPWEMLPAGFPSYKTVQRRLKRWLERDAFRAAWRQLAGRYERLHGINWDQVLLDGSKKPSKKGANGPAPRRSTGANPARRCTWPATIGPCHSGW
jgi:transposase